MLGVSGGPGVAGLAEVGADEDKLGVTTSFGESEERDSILSGDGAALKEDMRGLEEGAGGGWGTISGRTQLE